eukprot:CAMPEP_0204363392 /NCGR_PEP_ID=MMETSP0469-20131031/40347_1 /ASSEMBLY_ACC=CAM_ASM_000384 /TAXON_ID=2969 /ORGANISM="Oxyrrhis marina" /LENGTH=60 /DNA_ID=CAMNT_0051352143 /DNA_START=27 /DNA_END=209 /DNA_ORIENTATION=-
MPEPRGSTLGRGTAATRICPQPAPRILRGRRSADPGAGAGANATSADPPRSHRDWTCFRN